MDTPKAASAVASKPITARRAGTSTASTVSTSSTTGTASAASPSSPTSEPPDVEILPAPPMLDGWVEESPAGLPAGASVRAFSDRQQAILRQPISSDDLDILPTGELFLAQVRYRRILADAFGAGGWALIALEPYCRAGNTLVRAYALYCEGRFVSQAIGEADYHPNSARQTWATVAESVKSNALVRCCKDLLIGSDCWDAHFCESFKRDHCVRVLVDVEEQGIRKTRVQWRRKDAKPFPRERGLADDAVAGLQMVQSPKALCPPGPVATTEPSAGAPPPVRGSPLITESQQRRLFAVAREGKGVKALRDYLARDYGLESSGDIQAKDYDAICAWLSGREPGSDDAAS